MAARSFDVVILGGGNAGMGVTVATREAGLTVAMIEPDLLGGTCPNRGCMPKKVLVAAAHALDEIDRAKAHHITVSKPRLDWGALIDREKAMIDAIPGSLAELMKRRGVEVIRGHGRFAGSNAVAVDGEILEAKHIVIATGSKPRSLAFPDDHERRPAIVTAGLSCRRRWSSTPSCRRSGRTSPPPNSTCRRRRNHCSCIRTSGCSPTTGVCGSAGNSTRN